jgi:hypothetical protein
VVECQDRTGFLSESAESSLLFQEVRRQHFQGNFAIMLFGIFTKEYFTHPALAQSLQDAIMGNEFRNRILCA